jgi:hypothetical protein
MKKFGGIDSRCQFHQRFTRSFFVRKFVQSQNVTRKKAFVRKIWAFNVDEIDLWWVICLRKENMKILQVNKILMEKLKIVIACKPQLPQLRRSCHRKLFPKPICNGPFENVESVCDWYWCLSWLYLLPIWQQHFELTQALDQWFPTRLPRGGARGAAKNWNKIPLYIFLCIY